MAASATSGINSKDKVLATIDDAHCHASIPTVCFPFAGGTIGGSHISVVKLIQALDRSQFSPLVLLHRAEGQLPEFLRSEGVNFEIAPSPHFLGQSWGLERRWDWATGLKGAASQLRLAQFLRHRRVSIVHTNDGAMHLTWSLPAKLAGASLLWHHRSTPNGRGLRFLAPLVADEVAAVSHFALSRSRYREKGKARVVYSPFDTREPVPDRATAHQALTEELSLPDQTHLIGFFGNVDLRKRPVEFVDMLAALATIAPDLAFAGLMFGETLDPALEACVHQRAAHHHLGDRFKFMGFRRPVMPLMAACDIHAVSAVDEPFGRSLIEAMLVGTPVVAAASGGNLEAIEDGFTGCLVPPDDPQSMAHEIARLLASPDRRAVISRQARAHAECSFGIDVHAEHISRIYRSMIEQDGAG